MKYLHLNLKRKWYDMILERKKLEEYREIKPHYISLLFNWRDSGLTLHQFIFACKEEEDFIWSYLKHGQDTLICFSNGYKNDRPEFEIEWEGIDIRTGNIEWGAKENKKYFVLELGNELRIIRE